MLIITRRPGETIMVGDEIAVTVVSMTGGEVRIGITAPREQRILRSQIYGRDPKAPTAHERARVAGNAATDAPQRGVTTARAANPTAP